MLPVWFLFKLIETCLGMMAMGYHLRGFVTMELNDNLRYCAVFFVFILVAMNGNLNICIGEPPSLLSEAIVSMFSCFAYIVVSIDSMYHAEKDFYMMYLSDFEKPLHPFFRYSKAQSISALCAGCTYLMHAVFAIDAILIKDVDPEEIEDEDSAAKQPIKLYLFGKYAHEQLDKREWFQRYSHAANQPEPEIV